MTKREKEQILQILYDCIVKPEADEEDEALVNYWQAKTRIMLMPDDEEKPNPFDSVLQLLLDFDLGTEWDGDVEELACYICQLFKQGPYARREEMLFKRASEKKALADDKYVQITKKELAIATIQVVYNSVPENQKLREALKWAMDELNKVEEEA